MTCSSTCSEIVLVQLNCSTTWASKTCFTAKMLYSVSSSVSRTGSQDLKTWPRAASSLQEGGWRWLEVVGGGWREWEVGRT